MKKYSIVLIVVYIAVGFVFGQEPKYPFPQKITYPHGILPTKRDSVTEYAKQWYESWKKTYLQECNGNIRPGVDPLNKSLVEAQGFAMVAVAYMGEKDIFDKLFNFYKSKTTGACGLMNWKVNCNSVESNGHGAATDGDVDVACALIVADWQWPGEGYDNKAKSLIKILEGMVLDCGGIKTLYPGCNSNGQKWGGCNETDISYYTPAFFRYFAKYSGNNMWDKLADDTHTIRDNAANKTTGLVPDWQSVSGHAGSGNRTGNFAFDAIRAPYKQTLDFLWHGNKKAEAWCQRLTNWAHGKGPENITDGYSLNGSQTSGNKNMAVLGSMAVAAMANEQEILDDFVEEAFNRKDDYWYSGYLGNLYLLALSGNIWNPEIIKDKVGTTQSLNHKTLSQKTLRIKSTIEGHSLVVSNVDRGSDIILTSLDGQRVKTVHAKGGSLLMDISSVKSGCYLLSLTDHSRRIRESRLVSVLP